MLQCPWLSCFIYNLFVQNHFPYYKILKELAVVTLGGSFGRGVAAVYEL